MRPRVVGPKTEFWNEKHFRAQLAQGELFPVTHPTDIEVPQEVRPPPAGDSDRSIEFNRSQLSGTRYGN